MVFDDDYLQQDRYYREHILGGDDEYDEDYGDMEEQGYDAMADDDVYDNAPQGGCQPNVFGCSRYDEEDSEEADLMQRVWRDYHVLGYADDDGDDHQAKPRRTSRQERAEPSGEIRFQPMSKKYREMSAKRQEEQEKQEKQEKQEAARIIRTNRAVCIAVAAAVLISLLLILL